MKASMRRARAVVAAAAVPLLAAADAYAIPAFAERFGVECHMCHQGFPKLNKTGYRFKEHGFRLDNEDPFQITDWIKSIPLRARASATRNLRQGADDSTVGFVRLVSAGSFGRHVSYWADAGFLFDDSENTKTYTEPTDIWMRLDVLSDGRLYVRAGRMELDLPFTQVRTPQLFSYPTYFTSSGRELDTIGAYQRAVEVGGSLSGDRYHWSAAITGGAEDAVNDDFEGNLFLRAHRRGDTSRFGVFSYLGRNTLAATGPAGAVSWRDHLLRLGGDVDLWPLPSLNVYGLYMYARNSDSAPAATGDGGGGMAASFHGGFAQADYHLVEKSVPGPLKDIALALTARASWQQRPTSALTANESITAFHPGFRFWLRERFRLSVEYGFEGQGRGDRGAVQAELVF